MLFSAIEVIEVSLRTRLAHFHSEKYGPLGYLDAASFNKKHDVNKFKQNIDREIENNKKIKMQELNDEIKELEIKYNQKSKELQEQYDEMSNKLKIDREREKEEYEYNTKREREISENKWKKRTRFTSSIDF